MPPVHEERSTRPEACLRIADNLTTMATVAGNERPLRSDAERNRRRILAVAAERFAVEGLEASLEGIAAEARVGIGTVYRRFGDREGLIDALFEERMEQVAAVAERALKQEDPWQGLEDFLREVSALHVADRGLREAWLSPARGRECIAQARDRIAPMAARILERAREDGRLRDDIGAFDVPMLQEMLGAVADVARDVAPELWQRYLGILLDGMRARRDAPTPLPYEPLDAERYASAWASRRRST
jgi:AcrR family transcriptional regulator